MAHASLATATLAEGQQVYLDTSALFTLAMGEAARLKNRPMRPVEQSRAAVLVPFLERCKSKKSPARTSVIAFEELAALIRNRERKDVASRFGENSWRDFKKKDPAAAAKEDRTGPWLAMRQVLEFLMYPLDAFNVKLLEPVSGTLTSDEFAKNRRKALRKVLTDHAEVDPMDALHIVLARELAIDTFVSFDCGWSHLPNITVLR